VLVTGGAKGIGRMISEGFVTNGAKVYISSRDAKACEQACKELNALGKGSAHAIPADFYKLEDCKKMADELKKRESKLHVLVNNSGSNWGEDYDTVCCQPLGRCVLPGPDDLITHGPHKMALKISLYRYSSQRVPGLESSH
jgi:NAD(P)-dependent dehydrogenase (short-subunit alcohol dehydrogenase family)